MIDRHRNADGTYNGVAVMADVSGLTQESVKSIWRQVKANAALLDACQRHDFVPAEPGHRSRRPTSTECRPWRASPSPASAAPRAT